jgi:hypothetical protein
MAMSDAHTIGFVRCITFRGCIYSDTNIDASYAALPRSVGDRNLAPINARASSAFDTTYLQNMLVWRDLFHSDQEAVATTW